MENRIIDEKIFSSLFKKKLTEDQYKRALKMLKVYDSYLSWDVANVLLKSLEENKFERVLRILENHHKDKSGIFGKSKKITSNTQKMFTGIMEKILGFVPR